MGLFVRGMTNLASAFRNDVLAVVRDDHPAVTERSARLLLTLKTLFGMLPTLLLPHLLAAAYAWRAWQFRPFYFWRPFTVISLMVAVVASTFWPSDGGYAIFLYCSGRMPLDSWNPLGMLMYFWASSFFNFWLALLPHAILRNAYRLRQRFAHSPAQP